MLGKWRFDRVSAVLGVLVGFIPACNALIRMDNRTNDFLDKSQAIEVVTTVGSKDNSISNLDTVVQIPISATADFKEMMQWRIKNGEVKVRKYQAPSPK